MKKDYLDNYYENAFKQERKVFAISAPLAFLYKHLYTKNQILMQEKHDLSLSEIDILASLVFNNKIMTPTNLYEATFLSSGGMTKILKKLEDKKLIKRVASKEDKRSFLVKIEKKGEDLLSKCFETLIQIDEKLFSVLDEKEQEGLKVTLKKIIYSLID